MIVLSGNLVLSPEEAANPNNPLIGTDLVTIPSGIVADTEDENHPASELANPATDLFWTAANTTTQFVTLTTNSADDLNFVGIAGSNFAEAGIAVSLEADDGGGYDELIEPFVPPDDRPLILRYTDNPYASIRLRVAEGDAPARMSVMYTGKLLAIPRRIYVGHTPITFSRELGIINGTSQNGEFLGSVEVGRTNKTPISLKNLDRDWYRTYLDPIINDRSPFFWAWRPSTFPREVGYVWLTNNPKPQNQRNNGMMSVDLQVEGLA